MPSLRLCGHRTFLAGDDLRFYSICALSLRLIQLAVLIPLSIRTWKASDGYRIDNSDEYCRSMQTYTGLIDHSHFLFVPYFVLSFVLCVVGIFLEVGIRSTTAKGNPTQPELRWMLKPLCNIKMIPMSVLRVVVIVFGVLCVLAIKDYCYCGTSSGYTHCPGYGSYGGWHSYFACLVVTHAIEAGIVAFYGLYFLCKATPQVLTAERKWQVFCKCCCTFASVLTCCLTGPSSASASDFMDVSLILSGFFDSGGTVDVVLSDIAAGFTVLAREHKKRERASQRDAALRCSAKVLGTGTYGRRDVETGNEGTEITLDEDSDERIDPKLLLVDATQKDDSLKSDETVKKALNSLQDDEAKVNKQPSTYRQSVIEYQLQWKSGKAYFEPTEREVLSPTNALDKLAVAEGARFMRFATGIYSFKEFQYGFYPCIHTFEKIRNKTVPVSHRLNEDKMFAKLGLSNSEVVYAQLGDSLSKTPYSILVDHSWKSVVVVIAGTQTLDDVVNDMTLWPQSLHEWGERCGFDGSEYFVHKGILQCTEWIYNDLESHGLLDKLLLQESSDVAEYQLRLTGHSLGAGVASILSFFLKPKFPNLRALCFEPPGCTVSLNMADDCKDYLTSYIHADDIIPRFSLKSLEHLRDDILKMIARIKVPKHQAMSSKADVDTLVYARNAIPETEFSKQLNMFRQHKGKEQTEVEECSKVAIVVKAPLYPPGRLMHLINETEYDHLPAKRCFSCTKVESALNQLTPGTARWMHRDDLAEIRISSHFISDHSSDGVLQQLELLAEDFGLKAPFVLEDDAK